MTDSRALPARPRRGIFFRLRAVFIDPWFADDEASLRYTIVDDELDGRLDDASRHSRMYEQKYGSRNGGSG